MKFTELKKLVLFDVKFESLGAVGVDAFLYNHSEDRKYSIRVEFKFGANADDFLKRGEWEVALNSLVDSYFEKVKDILPTELLSEFFEEESKRKNKLKAELLASHFVCKIEPRGTILKKPVIVIKNANQSFSIDFPSTWYSTKPTLARSTGRVSYEIIIKPADRAIQKKLVIVLGREFS